MANNEDKLSRLYREGLGDFAKDPPPEVWSGIKHGLLIRKLVTFRFMTSLNIYSVAAFITIAALAGFIIGKQFHQKNDLATANKNISTIVKNIPKKAKEFQEIKEQQNIKHAKAIDKPASNYTTDNQIRNQTSVTPKVRKESIKISEKPVHIKESVYDPSQQKDNFTKPTDILTETPVIIDSSLKKEPEKQPSQNNLTNDKKNLLTEQPKKQLEPANDILISKKPKTVQGFYAEIFGAPSLLTYKFKQSTVNPNLTFVTTSKGDEKPALSYTAGLELGYGLKKLFVQTGINYSDYRSKALIGIIKTEIYSTYEYTKDSVWWYKDSMGKNYYHYTYDTIENRTTKDTTISYSSTNSMRYIEIPVLIGYRFYGKRITCAVIGGISFGYLTSSGGQILNPDLKSISVNTKEAIPYKPWTYYLILRAEAAYLLNNNLSVFIRPGFKYNMNSVFEDYYPVQKSFYAIDLHFGLRYNF